MVLAFKLKSCFISSFTKWNVNWLHVISYFSIDEVWLLSLITENKRDVEGEGHIRNDDGIFLSENSRSQSRRHRETLRIHVWITRRGVFFCKRQNTTKSLIYFSVLIEYLMKVISIKFDIYVFNKKYTVCILKKKSTSS